MKCMNCGGTNDVIDFYKGDEKVILCANCRLKMASGQQVIAVKQIGRPSLGVTKKVSITLPSDAWGYLDSEAEGNRSEYLRKLIERDQWEPEQASWSNSACLGYAIYAARDLGFNEKEIEKFVRAMYRTFDFHTIEEAKSTYNNSPY